MRRALLTTALAAVSLFAVGGVAQAQTPPTPPLAPEFAPPTPGPVTDTDSAANFAKFYAARNASRFLGQDRRRVRVTDADAACLQSPIIDTRFGCVFTLKALVIQRDRGWEGLRAASSHSRRDDNHGHGHKKNDRNDRVRVRRFGCLGFLRINGGPTVTPTAQVVQVECARIPRDDFDITVPTPVT